jgi:hypothetical protein
MEITMVGLATQVGGGTVQARGRERWWRNDRPAKSRAEFACKSEAQQQPLLPRYPRLFVQRHKFPAGAELTISNICTKYLNDLKAHNREIPCPDQTQNAVVYECTKTSTHGIA